MAVYFEDLQEGSELPAMVKGPISQVQLVRYAGASGDFNPIHTVPDIAKMVGLPGTIAHGMLIMAVAGQFLTDWAGVAALRRFKVRFSGMTQPTEYLVCEGTVTRLEEADTEGLVHGRLTIKGKQDGSLKIKGEFTVAVPRRI